LTAKSAEGFFDFMAVRPENGPRKRHGHFAQNDSFSTRARAGKIPRARDKKTRRGALGYKSTSIASQQFYTRDADP
jgi:hypothetical protein